MYGIAQNHEDISHPHAIMILNNFQGFTRKSLQKLEEKNWITVAGQEWAMTAKGFKKAKNLYNQLEDDE